MDASDRNEIDSTERLQLENELRSRAKQQEALAQLGERALVEPDLERLLNDAVSTVALTLAIEHDAFRSVTRRWRALRSKVFKAICGRGCGQGGGDDEDEASGHSPPKASDA